MEIDKGIQSYDLPFYIPPLYQLLQFLQLLIKKIIDALKGIRPYDLLLYQLGYCFYNN